ncbi:MAG: flavin reductase family protein [Thaumarchaeota archaeon]|nr:flavin reductase family protein [Nitrososphaerota archaeon]
MTRKLPGKAERYFTTGISMITSHGPNGSNVMAAEWVMQISYNPILIAIFIHKGSQTLKNIEKTKEFGVNVASEKQTSQVSVAGGYSGSEIDKLQIKNLFNTVKSKKIRAPSISGCTINAECILVKKEKTGDHVMLVGKAIHIQHDESQSPLIYHRNRYFQIGHAIEPQREEIPVDRETFEFFTNLAQKRFVLKCIGVTVKSKNKILVVKQPNSFMQTIPLCIPPSGKNHTRYLEKFLKKMKLDFELCQEPIMKRFVLKYEKNSQRINMIQYNGKTKSDKEHLWKPVNSDPILSIL